MLGVSGDGGLSIQLSSANITRNSLSGGSALALGGAGSKVVTGADSSSVVVEGNRGTIRTISVAEQPLVSNLLDIVLGIGKLQTLAWEPPAPTRQMVCALLRASLL